MLHVCGVGNNLHQLHHAAIFVAQDMAMQNVHACEIYESSQHLKVATRWDREIIPPDPRSRQFYRNPAVLFRIHDLDNLKRIDVDMERMGRAAVVVHGPLFSSTELHGLIDRSLVELLAIDCVYGRREGSCRAPAKWWRGLEMELPSDLDVTGIDVQ